MATSNDTGFGSCQRVANSRLLAYILILTPLLCQGSRVDVPTVGNFIRRWNMVAAVIGNYLYIDGGEISQYENGVVDESLIYQVNSTLSIDLSTSWTTSNASFRMIQKPNTARNSPAIWIDKADKGGFYLWGGVFSFGRGMTESEMWKFSADGQGGGSWSLFQNFTNPEEFAKLLSPESGAYTNTDDKGFLIGGYRGAWTQPGLTVHHQIIPGMVMFNMRTKEISNGTAGDEGDRHSPFETLIGAKAHFIPAFTGTRSSRGLIMVLGGHRSYVDRIVPMENSPGYDLRNLTFFDPDTREQYWQTATGDIPLYPRSQFCVTGFAVAGGGYDLFLFGGYNAEQLKWYEDAYVLSLPGFVWTKVPTPPAGPRCLHTCVSVGRQVVSIGGIPSTTNIRSIDAAYQGLLLFDMTTQTWKETYDPESGDYDRAKDLKSWYLSGGIAKVDWSSNAVKALFVKDTGAGAGADISNTGAGSNGVNPANLSTSTDLPDEDRLTTTGISPGAAAGAAVGGTAGSAILIALGLWLFRRHKTTKKQNVNLNNIREWVSPRTHLAEVANAKMSLDITEADASHGYSELPSVPENTFHRSARTTIDGGEVGVDYSRWDLPLASRYY